MWRSNVNTILKRVTRQREALVEAVETVFNDVRAHQPNFDALQVGSGVITTELKTSLLTIGSLQGPQMMVTPVIEFSRY